MNKEVLFDVQNMSKYFQVNRSQQLKAVDNVSFQIFKGETLGLVGESGCGKTTCGRTLLNLYPKTAGTAIYKGKDTNKYTKSDWKKFKKQCQLIFQDPYASLDPRMTISEIVSEGMTVHNKLTKAEVSDKLADLLEKVGLTNDYGSRFPHELSGGQRQRIGIARALALDPEFIVCDEPISALDVSIQAQIVNLLIELQKELKLTYLFISHDLSMVRHISDRIGVMYLGSMVELAPSASLYHKPTHPYTKALLSAIPLADPESEKTRNPIKLEGEVPSPINPLPGCRFKTRCSERMDICDESIPLLKEIEPGHLVACHKVHQS